MNVQLWSYNYDPEPTGIAPLSGVVARTLAARGHTVDVVAAHPHYPEPKWGRSLRPYREHRDGIAVLRLPLWVGHGSAVERIRQELTFTASLSLAAPTLGTPDVVVAVSPSFPALGPAMINAQARGIPCVLWVQDILPDGASATGLLNGGTLVSAARRFEQWAYQSASRIVVISDACAANLRSKGVPDAKVVSIYNPASLPVRTALRDEAAVDPRLVMTMGNIGRTQDLVNVTRAFESSADLAEFGARFALVGDGVAGDDVRAAIRTDRVEVTGVVGAEALEGWLGSAAVAVVSQQYEGVDWNLPSKLMNFMGQGLPVVAAVRPDSEVAAIVRESGGGWVSDNRDAPDAARLVVQALRDPVQRQHRGAQGLAFAAEHFAPDRTVDAFEAVLQVAIDEHSKRPRLQRLRRTVHRFRSVA